jgi:crossover junction endodeoxyribonuclease RuvC
VTAVRRVLGIDPGLERTGYGCIDVASDGWNAVIVEAGVVRLAARTSLSARLRQLDLELNDLLEELAPQVVAIESVFTHQRNLRTAILMAHARGVALLAVARHGLELVELPPATVKKSMTGNGNATKAQMQRAVASTFDLAAPPEPPDVADAIAIALAGARRSGPQVV